jgi:hypothetical protein
MIVSHDNSIHELKDFEADYNRATIQINENAIYCQNEVIIKTVLDYINMASACGESMIYLPNLHWNTLDQRGRTERHYRLMRIILDDDQIDFTLFNRINNLAFLPAYDEISIFREFKNGKLFKPLMNVPNSKIHLLRQQVSAALMEITLKGDLIE